MILKKCPNCESENPKSAKFCMECGAQLVVEEGAAAPQQAPPPTQEFEPELQAAPNQPEPPTEDFSVEPPDPQKPFGERYKVLEELGTGTLGIVYKVYDQAMEREQALKAVRPEMSQKAELFDGFARELKVERGVIHKNIARIFELNVSRGTPFLTMEFIAGKNLRSLLKEKKRLSVEEAVSLAQQLSSGLAYAHKLGALHLDLRPENVIIDKEGTAKITDLGIARLFRAKGILGSVAGRPQYMSPEQIEGREADARSDIYALGAMLYEMLTGNLPPVGEPARNPQEFNPSIPRELSLLVLKCIEPDKEKRYGSVQEIQAELEAIKTVVEQAPVASPDHPQVEKAPEAKPAEGPVPAAGFSPSKPVVVHRIQTKPKFQRAVSLPKKIVFSGLVVLAAGLLAVLLWRFFLRSPAGEPPVPANIPRPSAAVLPLENISSSNGHQNLGIVLAEMIIRSFRKYHNLLVPAIDSSTSFQVAARDPRQIGRRLGVDRYLDGTFEEREGKLKVEARLVQSDSAKVLWSGQFEQNSGDVFGLTEEIATAVGNILGLEARAERGAGLGQERQADLEALDLYGQARLLINKKNRENLEKAAELLSRAAAKDSAFALSLSALADVYIRLADEHYWAPEKAVPRAKEAALKALLLDSGLAEAHIGLARIKAGYEWDLTSAEREYREALRLDPDNAAAHQFYALFLSALGQHSAAIEETRLVKTLNPLSSEAQAEAARILFFARLYQEAEAEVKKALATDPLYPDHHFNATLIQVQLGQLDEALKSLEKAEGLSDLPLELSLYRACVYARQGRRQETGRILTEAFNEAKKAYVSQASLALVYAGLNEREQAIACLEKAMAARDGSLLFLRVHPFLDPVRGDLRFVGLLGKIGLGTQ